MDTWILPLT